MSDQAQNWLKYLFNEDIYILNDPVSEGIREEKAVTTSQEKKPETPVKNTTPEIPAAEVAVVVEEADLADHRELLLKILEAVELDLNKVDLHTGGDYHTLKNDWIFVFGPAAEGSIEKYGISKQGSQHIILSDSLRTLDSERAMKASLWSCLKIFRNR